MEVSDGSRACGTGRRSLKIREISKLDYRLTGVDISEEMCSIAAKRGLRILHQDWMNEDPHTCEIFDAATFLYAFGHIPSSEQRKMTLSKINSYLRIGGRLYIDMFNQNNANEWGPDAVKAFIDNDLKSVGYEIGDVFYRKNGLKEIAFIHYFDINQIKLMLAETGFELIDYKLVGYAKNSGQLVDGEDEGNFIIIAEKSVEI